MMLSHLLSFGFFPDHVVLAAERALHNPVATVVAASGVGALAKVAPAALVVIGRTHLRAEDVSADLAIRVAADRRAAGLLLQHPPGSVPLATRTLAERSGVPLVLVDHTDPGRLVPAMDRFVRSPETADAALISVVAHRLRTAGDTSEDIVRMLANALHHPVGLVDTEGRLLAGRLPADALRACAAGLGRRSGNQSVHSLDEDTLLVVQPVRTTPSDPANLSLVAVVPLVPAARVRTTSQVLGVATWALVAHLAATAVRLERQSKQHSALLTRLLSGPDEPPRQVLEHATAAGWVLGGTHTGIHVRARGGTDRALVRDRLGERLRERGVAMHPVPDADGWSLWTTASRDDPADVAVAVRHALLAAERDCPGARLYAGVGTADDGTEGLRKSLREARRACVLAAARNRPGAVEHIGTNSVKRLLSNQYLTTVQLDLAHQLLQPLLVADASGQLVHTLSCYLDNESSATAAAAALGVHRNTVLQRLDRIRALLTVEFNDADERLALQLATRLVQSGPDAEGATGSSRPARA
jgi:hypothetical protein